MKIYNKNHLLLGLFWVVMIALLFFEVIEGDFIKWLIATFLACKFLYSALSREGNAETERRRMHYKEAATKLYGRHYAWRTNLPLVVFLPSLFLALILRLCFGVWISVWVVVALMLLVTVASFYSYGVERSIEEYINANFPLGDAAEESGRETKPSWNPER